MLMKATRLKQEKSYDCLDLAKNKLLSDLSEKSATLFKV